MQRYFPPETIIQLLLQLMPTHVAVFLASESAQGIFVSLQQIELVSLLQCLSWSTCKPAPCRSYEVRYTSCLCGYLLEIVRLLLHATASESWTVAPQTSASKEPLSRVTNFLGVACETLPTLPPTCPPCVRESLAAADFGNQ